MRYLLLLIYSTAPLWSQNSHHPIPVHPKQFAVMAWGGSPSDADQLRGMREAGLNISGFCGAGDLGTVKAAGLTCFIRDAQISGRDLMHLPSENEIRRTIARIKDQIGSDAT